MSRFTVATILFGSLTIAAHAQTASTPSQGIVVSNPWARPSVGTAAPSAAYFVITDHGAADRLVSLSTPVAGRTELHESLHENGIMKMRAVPGLALEPGKPVTLAPGGYHVMLMELKQPLKAGDSFPLTLTFEKAPPQTVEVKVGTMGGAMPMHGGHMQGGQMR
ncbi:MAG: copper chaperone PCu(A)C [Acetobacteraceae bacterium]